LPARTVAERVPRTVGDVDRPIAKTTAGCVTGERVGDGDSAVAPLSSDTSDADGRIDSEQASSVTSRATPLPGASTETRQMVVDSPNPRELHQL